MNKTQLIHRTRRLLAEITPRFWSDAEDVLPALNQMYAKAQSCVAAMGRPQDFQKSWNHDLQANLAVYPRMSFEPVEQYRRLDASSGEYLECTLLSLRQIVRDSEGNVTRWPDYPNFAVVEWNDKLILLPTPTADQAAGLRIVLRTPFSLVGDNDEPRLPEELHTLLASGAAAYLGAEERTGDRKEIAKQQAEFDEFFSIRDRDCILALQRIYQRTGGYTMSMVPQTPGGVGRSGPVSSRWYAAA